MAKTMILPAALQYQKEVGEQHRRRQGRRRRQPAGRRDARARSSRRSTTCSKGINALEKAVGHHAEGEPYDHAKHMPRATSSRPSTTSAPPPTSSKTIVADDLWPLPTYREMLFIK